jgi:hypothetical protein
VTLAVSIVLLAVGSVLVWGIDAKAAGLDLDVIGVVAIVTGLAGALLAAAIHGGGPAQNERVRRGEYHER